MRKGVAVEPMILTLLPVGGGGPAILWEVPEALAGSAPPLRIRRPIETPDGPHVEEWERAEVTSERRADYWLARILPASG